MASSSGDFDMDIATAQHYIECALCFHSAEFYCQSCDINLCHSCKDEHIRTKGSEIHEVVLYRDKLPTSHSFTKCPIHPDFTITKYCQKCVVSICLKCVEKNHKKHVICDFEHNSVPMISTVAEYAKLKAPGRGYSCHITCVNSNLAWISDWESNMILTDIDGKQEDQIEFTAGEHGFHSVTSKGDLLFADQIHNCINIYSNGIKKENYINTAEWTPISVFSSKLSGNILVGMWKEVKFDLKKLVDRSLPKRREANITRYDVHGTKIQRLKNDRKGNPLYQYPIHMSENRINGDICASNNNGLASGSVVVVDILGKHRFSYTGQNQSRFDPHGICTDILGNIVVYDDYSGNIHMLNANGHFLRILLSEPERWSEGSQGLCIDNSHRLWYGHKDIISVYTYLKFDVSTCTGD